MRGFARRSAQGHRQLLGRRDPRHALRAAAALPGRASLLPGLAGRAAELRALHAGDHAGRARSRSIGQGPVASQEFIKELGTNGGGFFNANSSHPYENPTPLTNLLEMLAIFLIPAGLTYTFGKMVGNTRQGWAIFAAMAFMFLGGLGVCYWAEAKGNPNVAQLGVMTAATAGQPGGNMEGKETRFGIANSALFATVTTDASCGAVNSMHDSYTPLGGMVPLVNMMCDEMIFGGVGAGLYGMLMYAVVAVFIAGLMVGRTPEYIGKKIEKFEVRMAILAVLILFANVVLWTAFGTNVNLPPGSTSQTFTDAQKAEEDEAAGGASRCRLESRQQQQPHHLLRRYLQQRQQLRRARLLGDPVSVRFPDGQQRLRLRRPHGQHALLQPDGRVSRC